MGLMKLGKLKEKLGFRKTDSVGEKDRTGELRHAEEDHSHRPDGSVAPCASSESVDLTEKLKAAFHEKPKEDKQLERRKELDKEIRGFRKSFRQEVRDGAKQIRKGVVGEVKGTITTIKTAAMIKRKEKDTDQAST